MGDIGMSNETSKSWAIREARGDFNLYLKGNGIDIGCGPDVLRVKEGNVRGWDMVDGDAMRMEGIEDETYDFVYSSHCLEHLTDVKLALKNWVRILKINGFLYFVVPDYALFEGGEWPSRYNGDHKHSFSLFPRFEKHEVEVRTNHHMMNEINRYLQRDLSVVQCELALEDEGYDYTSDAYGLQTYGRALAQIVYIGQKLG